MKILVYPKDPNPYQSLLYNNIKNKIEVKYLEPLINYYIFGTIFFPLQLVYYRILGYNIFHLHWTYNFKFPINNIFFRLIATFWFLFFLIFIKILNYKLVWTVHNLLPGEKRFVYEINIRKILSKFSNAKIVHSKLTIEKMKEIKLDTSNIYIIPHGNYIEYYENLVNRSEARKYFKISEDAFVFLFFGRIDPYKGVDNLLDAFVKINKINGNTILLIGGVCDYEKLNDLLKNYKQKLKDRIKIDTNYIINDKIQYYYNCADVVVCPFNEITTSGSVLLALSFGKPIICPNIGNLNELPKNIAFLYNKDNNNKNLFESMKFTIKNKNLLKQVSKNALEYAQSISWQKNGRETYQIYKTITKN